MSITRKIAHNTFWQFIGRSLGLGFSLVSLGIITRYLGLDRFGNYITVFVYLQFFSIIADFGLTLMTVQIISEQKGDNDLELKNRVSQVFSNIFTLRLLLSVIFLIISVLVVWFFPYPLIVKIGVLISSLSFLFNSLSQILQGVFQRNLQMIKPTIAEVITKFAFLSGAYFASIYEWQLYSIFFIMVATSIINFSLIFYWSKEFVSTKIVVNWPIFKDIIKRSWPIGVSIIFNLIYLKADILILSLYVSQADVALYGAAYRAIDVLTVFPYLFIGMILPLLSTAWANGDKKMFNNLIQKGFDALTIIAIPLMVGTWFLSEKIITLIAGKEFAESGNILKILIIGLGMIYLGNVFSHAVIAINKQKKMMWGFLFVAITSLVGYLVLIPLYSYWGAVIVTVYSEVIATIIAIVLVSRSIKKWPSFVILFKSVIASSIMALVLKYTLVSNIFLSVALGAFIYFLIMFFIKGIDKSIIKELRLKQK